VAISRKGSVLENIVPPRRKGFNGTGLAGMFDQNPAQQRMFTPFGKSGGIFGSSNGRSDFTGGILGGNFGGRSAFGGKGSSALDFGSMFADVAWDPATGLRVQPGGVLGAVGDALAGPVGSPGGKWAPLDAYNAAISKAASRWGVDPNRIKAHMMIESGGNPAALQVNPTHGNTVGLMQINPAIWGGVLASNGIDIYTPEGNIEGAAWILNDLKNRYGSWDAASSAYFTGSPGWNGVDTVNGTTGGQYRDTLNGYIAELNAAGGGGAHGKISGSAWGSGGGSGGWTSIFGPAGTPISYEFDAPTVNGAMYNYASASGMSGWSHPGLDVSVPRNTPLYSPGSGTVSCVGSGDAGIGGTGGGSCGYFGDSDGGGVGNVTIKLDNGTFVILGHSASANVQPGQRVNAGQMVATSGGMFGAHTHLEVRVPDSSTASGYRIVDPRTVLGGGAGNPGGAVTSPGNYTPAPQTPVAVNGAHYTPGFVIPTRIRRIGGW
jgi:murein DD-endopeptidase MepM/ murein hydrolase activator NlpD